MEIKDVRRANLAKLIASYGTIEALAAAAGTSASYLSQLKNGTAAMGTRFARTVEQSLGLERGWFDTPERGPRPAPEAVPLELALFRRLTRAQREAIVVILRAMTRD